MSPIQTTPRFQFSLANLLISMALIGVGLASPGALAAIYMPTAIEDVVLFLSCPTFIVGGIGYFFRWPILGFVCGFLAGLPLLYIRLMIYST